MGTGFTWNTQDCDKDIAAAREAWNVAAQMLTDECYRLVVLDELTYMLSYDYLDEGMIIDSISARPSEQSVVITGRGVAVLFVRPWIRCQK
jgi:cob(I)alamin adenosyltransferase